MLFVKMHRTVLFSEFIIDCGERGHGLCVLSGMDEKLVYLKRNRGNGWLLETVRLFLQAAYRNNVNSVITFIAIFAGGYNKFQVRQP